MTTFVIDASVAVSWLIPDEHHTAARRVLGPTFLRLAPTLIWPEVANALWKRSRRDGLTAAQVMAMLEDFAAVSVLLEPIEGLTTRALEIALETGRAVYDCAYLALAEAQGCRVATADVRFYNALKDGPYGHLLLWAEDIPEL